MFKILFLSLLTVGLGNGYPSDYWKVVGGQEAADGAYPFAASLRNGLGDHFCGGSVITARSVLTAAHCIFGRFSANVSAVVGTNKLNSGGQKYQASSLKLHFDYEPRDLRYDIGIVVLNQEIVFSSTVSIIALESSYIATDTTTRLVGWGYNSYPGTVNNVLLQIDLITITVPDCRSRMIGINVVYEHQLCTLSRMGEGTCFGDSGGPLVIGDKLVGIVSWGSPSSCGVGLPDVFTRISSFISWVNSNKV